jgi:DNA excision repair protein ERCC-2
MKSEDFFFPFGKIRPVQDRLIEEISSALDKKENLIAHAPTGLGKTIASLGPALKKAEEEELTVFFLTSRHTQHKIAVETLKEIKKVYGMKIITADIIGKKWMCLQPGTNLLSSGEFSEYCKKSREHGKCEFYNATRTEKGLSTLAKSTAKEIENSSPNETGEIMKLCEEEKLCPYEMSLALAKKARVIIADYYYVFNPSIMLQFFAKSGKELAKSIIIADEAHNLPKRIRDMMSARLSTATIKSARSEAKELKNEECPQFLDELQTLLIELLGNDEEKTLEKGSFIVGKKEEMIELFENLSEETISRSKRSYLATIANFLANYSEEDGYANIIRHVISRRGEKIEIIHSCLDPSLGSENIFDSAYCSILMSGTLKPVKMYKEILGLKAKELEFQSPFPKKNKLSLIAPDTTTKFSERSTEQYKNIAKSLAKICNAVPGNTAVFFPSYFVRDSVYHFFSELCRKTILTEIAGMTGEEKDDMINRFKMYKASGAVLLAAASGSFGEGIDLPGDFLKCVVIVGLPLNKPDLETQALINYYEKKYSSGWDYGYVLPAISRAMQNAGRCIRSETDKGVIVFMDKRYAWENYRKCLPEENEISHDYENKIKNFFSK